MLFRKDFALYCIMCIHNSDSWGGSQIDILDFFFEGEALKKWGKINNKSPLLFYIRLDLSSAIEYSIFNDQGRHQRGGAGVLVPNLGFYKNRGLGWVKKLSVAKPQNISILLFACPTLNPGVAAPDYDN